LQNIFLQDFLSNIVQVLHSLRSSKGLAMQIHHALAATTVVVSMMATPAYGFGGFQLASTRGAGVLSTPMSRTAAVSRAPLRRNAATGALGVGMVEEVEYVKIFGRLGEKLLFGDSSAVRRPPSVPMPFV